MKRHILADLHDKKLDPKKPHRLKGSRLKITEHSITPQPDLTDASSVIITDELTLSVIKVEEAEEILQEKEKEKDEHKEEKLDAAEEKEVKEEKSSNVDSDATQSQSEKKKRKQKIA